MYKILLRDKIGPHLIGIVDTPCYPCYLYVGHIFPDGTPKDNSTYLFHRDESSAMDAYSSLMDRTRKRLK